MTSSDDDPSRQPAIPSPLPVGRTDVHPLSLEQSADLVLELAHAGTPAVVVTPNVDHLVMLERSAPFREAYAGSTLRVCDGMPVLALLRLLGRPVPGRVNGTDLFNDVCTRAAAQGVPVFVAGGLPDVLERALLAMPQRFPGLVVEGHSPPFGFEGTEADLALQQALAAARPRIVMVCVGAPRSEIWAAEQQHRWPAVYLCVGSAIDFAAGARRRAPRWMQRTGTEWLHRLLQEPGRLWRRYLVQDSAFLLIAGRELWWSRRGGPR